MNASDQRVVDFMNYNARDFGVPSTELAAEKFLVSTCEIPREDVPTVLPLCRGHSSLPYTTVT